MSEIEEISKKQPWAAPHLLGHQQAEAEFIAAAEQNRLAHAWLITGQEGIGKATLAYRLARYMLNKKEEAQENLLGLDLSNANVLNLDPREDDPLYRQVANRAHPNMRVVERRANEKTGKLQTEISVDEIRQLGDFMRLTADAGSWRIVLIDAVDDLNRNAANALLKSLEEPRPNTLLFLISHNPGRLLPTIRSRCRQLSLSPLPDEDIGTQLPDTFSDEDRSLILNLAAGSLGKALELADGENLQTFKSVWSLLLQWPDYNMNELHRLGDVLSERNNEKAFERMIDILRWWWWRFCRFYAQAALHPVLPNEWELAEKWARSGDLDQWLELWEKITRLFARVDSANADRKQAWLNAMLEIGAMGQR